MREFAKGSFSLRHAPSALRIVYGAFLILIAPGFLSHAVFQVARIGLTPTAIAAYYRGAERDDVMAFPKTAGQLLEVTHAHAFVMGVLFLILAHLFLSTSVSTRSKAIVLGAAFVGTFGDLVSPWLVRYGAGWCAWILIGSWAMQAAGNAALVAISGWECLGPGSA